MTRYRSPVTVCRQAIVFWDIWLESLRTGELWFREYRDGSCCAAAVLLDGRVVLLAWLAIFRFMGSWITAYRMFGHDRS